MSAAAAATRRARTAGSLLAPSTFHAVRSRPVTASWNSTAGPKKTAVGGGPLAPAAADGAAGRVPRPRRCRRRRGRRRRRDGEGRERVAASMLAQQLMARL